MEAAEEFIRIPGKDGSVVSVFTRIRHIDIASNEQNKNSPLEREFALCTELFSWNVTQLFP